MKIFKCILLTFLSAQLFAQSNHDFSTSSLDNWTGDLNYFRISEGVLKSNGPPETGSISMSTKSALLNNAVWEFWVKTDFNPSGSNYSQIFLTADTTVSNDSINGYYLRIGGSTGATDAVDLYRQDGLSHSKVLSGIKGTLGKEVNEARIKVVRHPKGTWEVWLDTLGGTDYVLQGEVLDTTHQSSEYFGIVCNHTSTRSDKFAFDEIKISKGPTIPVSAEAINDTTLKIIFSEAVKSSFPETAFYIEGSLVLKASITHKTAIVKLEDPLVPGDITVETRNLQNGKDKQIKDTSITFIYYKPIPYASVIINEVFPDPLPAAGLPEGEFIELYNQTKEPINLSGYFISDASTVGKIKEGIINPDGYIILCPEGAGEAYQQFGKVTEVTPWPSLNNSSDSLSFTDSLSNVIFNLSYSASWHKNRSKEEGGFSLEMIDPASFCQGKKNWSSSISTIGGTPGFKNSVFDVNFDNSSPKVTGVSFPSVKSVLLTFDERVSPDKSTDFLLDSKACPYAFAPTLDSVTLNPPFTLEPSSFYYLTLKNVADCKGNISDIETLEILFPAEGDSLQILINEVLFDPKPNGEDFVEIANNTDLYISLSDYSIGSIANSDEIETQPLSPQNYVLPPKDFVVITTDSTVLKEHYPKTNPGKIIQVSSMPPLYNEGGTVLLYKGERLIDRFDYSESYHNPLLSEVEGVSLERISLSYPTNTATNWHSASTAADLATPGLKNSQSKNITNSTEQSLRITPKTFTPDGDGYNDYTTIYYKTPEEGWFGKVKIFDTKGRFIKYVINTELVSTNGFFHWDGSKENGEKAPVGIYIVIIELFNGDGATKAFRETVAVGTKF